MPPTFSATVYLTVDRRMVLTANGNNTQWRTTIEERESGNDWQAVGYPGHKTEQAYLDRLRAELEGRLSRLYVITPAIDLMALAERYRSEAALGDPNALVIATMLKALEFALRDDPDTATRFLNDAHAYLRRRRPNWVPLGSGDPRLKRSGREPAASLELLKIAHQVIARLPPPRREGADDEDRDAYVDGAEELAWGIEHLFPAIYPKTPPERERVACALATTLSQMEDRDAERVAMAALRACGMPPKQASNAFSYIDKRKKRAADRQPAPIDHAPR